MKVWHDDRYLRISSLEEYSSDNCSDTVYVCFTGIGRALGGVDVQDEEFKKLMSGGMVFFVVDKTRSWGNAINFELLAEIIEPFCKDRLVYAIGNSMGAFLASVCSNYLYFQACICFSAQYSVHPSVVPEELRWQKYISNIEKHRLVTLSDYMDDRTVYFFLSGDHAIESVHWKKFPRKANVFNYVFKGFDHDLASDLKELGLLYEVIDFLVATISRGNKTQCLLKHLENKCNLNVFRYVD